jgi:hypothetical protein
MIDGTIVCVLLVVPTSLDFLLEMLRGFFRDDVARRRGIDSPDARATTIWTFFGLSLWLTRLRPEEPTTQNALPTPNLGN